MYKNTLSGETKSWLSHSEKNYIIGENSRIDIKVIISGSYLIRQRANGQFALMLKSKLEVKSMKIEEEIVDRTKFYYLSENRKFTALAKMVKYYKHKDLTENFNNVALRGVTLRTPYKEISYCFEGCRTFQSLDFWIVLFFRSDREKRKNPRNLKYLFQSFTPDQGNLSRRIDIWSGASYKGLKKQLCYIRFYREHCEKNWSLIRTI